MKFKIFYVVVLFLVISTLHFVGVFAGLYENNVRIDIPQHFLAGVAFGVIWIWWMRTKDKKRLSGIIFFISILGFVALTAVAWEVLEFAVWNFLPSFANSFKFYSPTIAELLGDIMANLAGGVAIGMYAIRRRKLL